MPQEISDGNRRKDDRGPKQVRVYVTRNGGRYVKANELMESAGTLAVIGYSSHTAKGLLALKTQASHRR